MRGAALLLAVVGYASSLALNARGVVLGLNKLSHNAAVCVADASSGALLAAMEKERLTRVKNDGGAVGDLVRRALEACDRELGDVAAVVANDHHRSVLREESAFRRGAALGLAESAAGVGVEDALDPYSAFPAGVASELSHHLGHALGAARTAPFSGGSVVVMDGMGEEARRFREGGGGIFSDADLDGFRACDHALGGERVAFEDVPGNARECESVYERRGGASSLTPVFKRWCVGVDAAVFGYADWFAAPMDSLGAGYSRCSHVIFGDWNACGKVMGLAPWASPAADLARATWGRATAESWAPAAFAAARAVDAGDRPRLYSGRVRPREGEGGLRLDGGAIAELLRRAAAALPASAFASGSDRAAFLGAFPPAAPRALWDWPGDARDAARACCSVLAYYAQFDLEAVARPLAVSAPGDVVLCGGVGLNSVLNGAIEVELDAGGRRFHVPCAPGDEGVALGCAQRALDVVGGPPLDASLLPYAGAAPSADDVDAALAAFRDMVVEVDEDDAVAACADVLLDGGIVFFYEGAAEFGPRALGHRSIVALASRGGVVDEINEKIKGREDFRPLAPAVLEEEAGAWFEDAPAPTPSMSRVWTLTEDAAARAEACAHVSVGINRGERRPARDIFELLCLAQIELVFHDS